MAASLVYSFCDYSVLTAPRWVGLQNFADLLSDEVFWIALKNTLVYVALALPLGLVLLVLRGADAGRRACAAPGIYRTLMFLPSLTPVVASAMTWIWIFNSQYGVLNHLLGKVTFGLIDPIPWLADTRTALPSLVLMSFWSVGQVVVILLAAMQDVPTALYEAADLDGAGWWRKVWHITIPLTSPVDLLQRDHGHHRRAAALHAAVPDDRGRPARADAHVHDAPLPERVHLPAHGLRVAPWPGSCSW